LKREGPERTAKTLKDHKMKLLENVIRYGRRPVSSSMLAACLLGLGVTPGFSSSSNPESIQATYAQDGNAISVTLVIYGYTTPSEMQILAQAFGVGQDRALVTALSETKAAGLCSLTGNHGFDVAFIQSVPTPTGREITFITNRPLQSDEANPASETRSFDLMVGQFDLNDTDNSKSTGFLFPASKLVVNEQGEFHYDLAGNPWSLVNILDSRWAPVLAERSAPDASGSSPQQALP
jgi:hypothetical protein